MKNRKLTWRHLKALHDLYEEGRTSAAIQDNAFILSLKKHKHLIGLKPGSDRVFLAYQGFKEYYELEFLEPYKAYHTFLTNNNIDAHARQHFDEYDLESFIFIAKNKNEIKADLSTIRHFSSVFFKGKGSKYLEKHPGIARIVCTLLDIEAFPGQDPKSNAWRFVVDHPSPRGIVLCENLANLKRPWVARQHLIELWYVGGNNIAIIEQIGEDKLRMPIHYSCDWDFSGLEIYSRLRKMLLLKGCSLNLLEPYDKNALMDINSPDHNSRWKKDILYSGLETALFSQRQLSFIEELITKDKWVEEESQNLIELLAYNIEIMKQE